MSYERRKAGIIVSGIDSYKFDIYFLQEAQTKELLDINIGVIGQHNSFGNNKYYGNVLSLVPNGRIPSIDIGRTTIL